MANQSNYPAPFPADLVDHAFDSALRAGILPQNIEDIIGDIRASELVDLVFRLNRETPGLRTHILETLPRSVGFATMHAWFDALFSNVAGFDHAPPRFVTLRNHHFVRVPHDVYALFAGPLRQEEQDRVDEQYGAQAFLRTLVTELWVRDPHLVNAFLYALRPPPPAAPVLLSQPEPQYPQQSDVDQAPLATASTSAEPKPRLYCPLCGRSAQEGDFRMLKSHWFAEHQRSNRSAAWLEGQRKQGQLGPWTAEEARMRGMDKESTAETEASKKSRAKMKSEVEVWRKRMQTNPLKWEKKAQEEDGYADWDPNFVDYTRQKRAAAKKKAEGKKQKKQGDKEGDKKGGK